MPGGLLNLVAYGRLNIILNGNPSKTFFRTTYAKYTNFGLQKFRIDYRDLNALRQTDDSMFEFVIPHNADLLMDTYFSVTLPNIWSPIYIGEDYADTSFCQPYEFKWIENLGAQLIRRVRYLVDGHIIQEFTGQYLYNMVQRDFSKDKRELFDKLIGNTAELNDPANFSNRNGNYPNASYMSFGQIDFPNGIQPSILGKVINIPLNIWSTLSTKMAFPLTCLQYNDLHIQVECRPLQELFVVRDLDYFNDWVDRHPAGSAPDYEIYDCPYISHNLNDPKYQMYYFLNEPPAGEAEPTKGGVQGIPEDIKYYANAFGNWMANIHLLATCAYLSDDERRVFSGMPQHYLIKEVYEDTKYNVTGSQRASINDPGLVTSWMWYFQRSDVSLRNEWSNYTNWEYNYLPYPITSVFDLSFNPNSISHRNSQYPNCPVTYTYNNMTLSGPLRIENRKNIMIDWGFLCDGKVRETIFPEGVVNLVEKYVRTAGNAEDGLYCYNFCLNTDPFQLQPSGAMNLSKFTNVEFEYTTILPYDISGATAPIPVLCDPNGNVMGVFNPNWKDYEYSYNLHIMEERYNVLLFEAGMVRLMFSR
jgi:hypothetical protein